jgi:signal transduction histidine kinase
MDSFETSIYNAVLISGIIIGAIIIYFLFSLIQQKRRTARAQRMYLLKEINLIENERKRVARDMHDELGTLLSIAKGHANYIRPSGEDEIYHFEKVNENLLKLNKRMGEIAINLCPSALEKKGLQFVLQNFLEELQEVTTSRIMLQCESLPSLSPGFSIHIFRIVQEACHNAVKHSGCSLIEVRLRSFDKKICLLIRDNGRGLNNEKHPENPDGQGLGSIKNRAEMLEARMVIHSSSRKGTEYYFEFPFQKFVNDKDYNSR